ncbi:MAG: YfiT family bacillithiol transferase [Gemmatimonadales bacterium]
MIRRDGFPRKRRGDVEELRFPTGRFSSVRRALSPDERRAKIQAIREAPARIRAAAAGLDDARLDTPYRDGGWTVRQVVHHVVDSHLHAYVRFRLALTENAPTIRPYDEKLWAELPDAKTLPIEPSLAILEALHTRWVALLDELTPEQFSRPLHHPENGAMTIDMLLELYGWHGRHHEAHITGLKERNGW